MYKYAIHLPVCYKEIFSHGGEHLSALFRHSCDILKGRGICGGYHGNVNTSPHNQKRLVVEGKRGAIADGD